jgi:hypothetical protein
VREKYWYLLVVFAVDLFSHFTKAEPNRLSSRATALKSTMVMTQHAGFAVEINAKEIVVGVRSPSKL